MTDRCYKVLPKFLLKEELLASRRQNSTSDALPRPLLFCKMLLVLTDAVKREEIMHEVFAQKRSLPQAKPILLNLPKKMLFQLTK